MFGPATDLKAELFTPWRLPRRCRPPSMQGQATAACSRAERPPDWGAVNTGLPATDIHALAIDPVTPATLYAGTYSGVFKSTNGGGSWNAVNTGLPTTNVNALAIDPRTPATLYAGTENGGVFKEHEWRRQLDRPTPACLLPIHLFSPWQSTPTPTTLYAGTYSGVFKSTNAGGDWSTVNTGLTATQVRALAIDPTTPAILYAGTFGSGVFKSTNGGGELDAVNIGLTATQVRAWRSTRRRRPPCMRGHMAAKCSRARTAAATGPRSIPA